MQCASGKSQSGKNAATPKNGPRRYQIHGRGSTGIHNDGSLIWRQQELGCVGIQQPVNPHLRGLIDVGGDRDLGPGTNHQWFRQSGRPVLQQLIAAVRVTAGDHAGTGAADG